MSPLENLKAERSRKRIAKKMSKFGLNGSINNGFGNSSATVDEMIDLSLQGKKERQKRKADRELKRAMRKGEREKINILHWKANPKDLKRGEIVDRNKFIKTNNCNKIENSYKTTGRPI
jgi:hypothetical protein